MIIQRIYSFFDTIVIQQIFLILTLYTFTKLFPLNVVAF